MFSNKKKTHTYLIQTYKEFCNIIFIFRNIIFMEKMYPY